MQLLESDFKERVVLQIMHHITASSIIAKHKVFDFMSTSTLIYFVCQRGRDNFHTTLDIEDYRCYNAIHVLNDCFIGEINSSLMHSTSTIRCNY